MPVDGSSVARKMMPRLILPLLVLLFLSSIDRVNVSFAALQMNADLGFTPKTYGLGVSLFFIGYVLLQLPSIWLLQRIGMRRWVCLIAVVWGLAASGMSLIQSHESFYVLRIILGIAEGGFAPGFTWYLTRSMPRRQRARAVGLTMLAVPISIIIGGPFSGWLMTLANPIGWPGWRWMFLVEGLPTILLGIASLRLFVDDPKEAPWLTEPERRWLKNELTENDAGESTAPVRARDLLGNSSLWLTAGCWFALMTGAYGLIYWLPQVVKHSYASAGAVEVGVLSALPWVAVGLGMLLNSWHSDKTQERFLHVSLAAMACGLFLGIAGASGTGLWALLALVVCGFFMGAAQGVFWSIPATFLSTAAAASGFALINISGNFAGVLGPALIGWVRERTGTFDLPVFAMAAVLLIGGGCVLIVRPRRVLQVACVAFLSLFALPHRAQSQGHIPEENKQAVKAPVPAESVQYGSDRWWAPGSGQIFPAAAQYSNRSGAATTLVTGGPLETRDHPFFTAIGSNGRACVTCHQPADGMSISTNTIQERWRQTQGKDPLFAPVDGSNCPDLPQDAESSHSLLLNKGLFRIFRPWPPRAMDGSVIEPQFTLEVIRDPTGCNTSKRYGIHSSTPMVSVFRRPRPVTNTRYLTAVGFSFEPKNGLPLPLDPETGTPMSGNIMADGRDGTLKIQAIEAMLTHLQAPAAPPAAQLQSILEFETRLTTAQSHDRWGARLDTVGANGGPEYFAKTQPGDLQDARSPVWSEYLPWKDAEGENPEQKEFRRSVARGAEIFAKKTFLIRDSAGITNMGFGNPVRNSCAFCHNMQHTGMDVAPGQVDLGTTNEPFAIPSPDLPLFRLTCKEGFKPHPHLGRVVYTQDPGYAITTGKCADIGKITAQQMRGLAARAPYFSNGSAATLRAIVDFYDERYSIHYTEQEKQDLVNLMSVL